MKLSLPLLGAVLFAVSQPPSRAQAQGLSRTYRNARFGTTVRYPANLVEPQPESDGGDGCKFVSRDGQIELTIYARRNPLARSASGEMRRALSDWKADGARLTYYRATGPWFVLSGYLGDDIFYEKTLLRDGVFHTLIWQYPKNLKKRLDASVARSVASFSVKKGADVATTPVSRTRSSPSPRKPPSSESRSGY